MHARDALQISRISEMRRGGSIVEKRLRERRDGGRRMGEPCFLKTSSLATSWGKLELPGQPRYKAELCNENEPYTPALPLLHYSITPSLHSSTTTKNQEPRVRNIPAIYLVEENAGAWRPASERYLSTGLLGSALSPETTQPALSFAPATEVWVPLSANRGSTFSGPNFSYS